MKLQKEYIILTAVILVLVLILIVSSDRNKMSYKLPKIEKIESDSISQLEINTNKESVLIQRSQDEWLIMPQHYKADPDKVNEMLDVIRNLTLTELVSDKENYSRYELDEENKIQIKAFKEGELVREFFIGKASSTYSHTYIKMAGSPHVFHARDSFRSTFEQNVSGLRDKSVMEFFQEEITGLILSGEFGSLELEKQLTQVEPNLKEQEAQEEGEVTPPKEEEVWLTQDEKEAKNSEVNSILSKLSSLNCDSYMDEQEKENLKNPVFTIIARGAKDYKLEIYKNREEEEEYPALSSENEYPFLLTKWTAESLMKKPEDILKENTED
ncbi:MAG TPA: DUF4340 domain-containing protein [Acidobacteriota bacterium]|nr:DUF4340 domain-containing protein [Acidobacteriota bacterium]